MSNFLGRPALSDQLQDLALTRAEPEGLCSLRGVLKVFEIAAQVRRGVELTLQDLFDAFQEFPRGRCFEDIT